MLKLTKRQALYNCIIIDLPNIEKSLKTSTKIDLDSLLDVLKKKEYNLAKELGYSSGGLSKLIKRFWPDKPSSSKKLCSFILEKHGLSYCIQCDLVYEISNFYVNKDRKVSYCKKCSDNLTKPSQAHRTALYRASKRNATPTWANLDKIRQIYDNCPEGHHVDHIIPLNGINICGLHVEYNLQYLPAKENCSKGNKFELL
jgi:hypothetical protein